MGASDSILGKDRDRDSVYGQAADAYGSSLDRLARAYELDPETRRDLLPDIHLHIWCDRENGGKWCRARLAPFIPAEFRNDQS